MHYAVPYWVRHFYLRHPNVYAIFIGNTTFTQESIEQYQKSMIHVIIVDA